MSETTRSMGLGALADRIAPDRVIGLPVGEVRGLAYDSRRIAPGSLFFAVPGDHTDGHRFVSAAVAAGAVGVVVEQEGPELAVPQLVVANSRHALADAADLWFGEPARALETIGVTGTNGKTTVAWLVTQLLIATGRRPGLLGTVWQRVGDETTDNLSRATTPEALELQELLAAMVAAGNDSAVIESSSHGMAQGRTRNCRYRSGIVTNLTHEHLEFHGTFEAYRAAKALLIEEAPLAILNRDDPSYDFFRGRARDRVVSFGAHAEADVRGTLVAERPSGSTVSVRTPSWSGQLEIPLAGAINVENALAAFAWAVGWGIDAGAAASAIASARSVAGRMEPIDEGQPFGVVVDYAHSPDALEKVLRVLRPLTSGRLAVVFGSGGERDTTKRAVMGGIAAELADLVYVTDEDPRGEDPDALNAEIASGARAAGARDGENLWVINDRRGAIAAAVAAARAGDMLLLAGKGHEHNMFTGSGSIWWDEAEVARQELRAAGYEGPHR